MQEVNTKIAELDCGLEIWKLQICCLKEQDINAQVMDDRRMKILTDNFFIISGHHRVKAANNAGLTYIYCLVDTNELTTSQITSKQIAHNELVGSADSEILAMLIKQMNEVDDIIASGLDEKYLSKITAEKTVIDIPHLDFDWRTITLAFLPKQEKEFEQLVKMIDKNDKFVKTCINYGRTRNIKSVATVISVLTEIALKEIDKWQKEAQSQNTTPKST